MTNRLLSRQLKKLGIGSAQVPTPEQWTELLNRVSKTYTESDQDRYLLERSLMISSAEMQEVYERLIESETRYALASRGANDGLWDWDLESENVYYSERWCEIMGVQPTPGQKPCKTCWFDRIHPEDEARVHADLDSHLEGQTAKFENEHRVLHTSGDYRWVLIRGLAVRDAEGKARRIAGSLTDITERKRAEEKLAFDAVHDPLTGLPNRKMLVDRLARSLTRARRSANFKFALLFVDLDRFKTINDSLGHQAGDDVLLNIAQRLTDLVRPSDMVARLGGDEFVILVDRLDEDDQASMIAERILNDLRKPMIVSGQRIYAAASIGIALGNSGYDNPEDLVRDADLAMYRAKVHGKGRYEVFDSKIHSGAVSALQMEIDMRQAIESREFVLHFQPIVSLASGAIVGFESLVRWQHPTRGLVPPNDFIPVAEETGLILPIGEWVIRESCRQMRDWQIEFPLARELAISVNLSAKQLEKKDLVEDVAKILSETGLDPNCLKLEITESVLMSNAEETVEKVGRLRQMGVRVSIDDFGTGYSSLSYLHRFKIDTLKVDRSFVSRIGLTGEHSEIVRTIITLAANLGMDVVAEGVENAEQLNFLRRINCDYGQGYYYSRPVESASVRRMFDSSETAVAPPISFVADDLGDVVH